MEDIVSFCTKTVQETNSKIEETQNILKHQLDRNEYDEIQKTIQTNENATKKMLHQRKFKKFNNLKYKPKPQVKATTEENEETPKRTYADILRQKNPTGKPSKTNNTKDSDSKQKPNIHERLRSLSPSNKHRKQGKAPSRNSSNTNQPITNKNQEKIKELEEQIKKLRNKQQETEDTLDIKTKDNKTETTEPDVHSKNVRMASVTNRGQEENLQIITVINFIEQTMKTLSTYGEQLKIQLDTNLTQQEM